MRSFSAPILLVGLAASAAAQLNYETSVYTRLSYVNDPSIFSEASDSHTNALSRLNGQSGLRLGPWLHSNTARDDLVAGSIVPTDDNGAIANPLRVQATSSSRSDMRVDWAGHEGESYLLRLQADLFTYPGVSGTIDLSASATGSDGVTTAFVPSTDLLAYEYSAIVPVTIGETFSFSLLAEIDATGSYAQRPSWIGRFVRGLGLRDLAGNRINGSGAMIVTPSFSTPVPEPASMVALAAGLVALRRRARRS